MAATHVRDTRESQPLGRKIDYPTPTGPEWVPTETKGIERNAKTGQLRTAIAKNELANNPFYIPPKGKP
jgi:hypothetical protein